MKRLLLCALFALVASGWTWDSTPAPITGRSLEARSVSRPAVRRETSDPRLDALASRLAERTVTVGCYPADELDSPASYGAWGYVYLGGNYEYLDQTVCDGLLGIFDPHVATWKKALGALVITHESDHLNLSLSDRGSEAKTECRAIRATGRTVRLLGGGDGSVGTLMPYALAIHWRIAALFPAYNLDSCAVPNWW